jgi:hypothetical protein
LAAEKCGSRPPALKLRRASKEKQGKGRKVIFENLYTGFMYNFICNSRSVGDHYVMTFLRIRFLRDGKCSSRKERPPALSPTLTSAIEESFGGQAKKSRKVRKVIFNALHWIHVRLLL